MFFLKEPSLNALILLPMSNAKSKVAVDKQTANQKNEFGRFTNLLDRLLAVPHSELKAKLDAEKQQKKAAKSGLASVHVSAEKG